MTTRAYNSALHSLLEVEAGASGEGITSTRGLGKIAKMAGYGNADEADDRGFAALLVRIDPDNPEYIDLTNRPGATVSWELMKSLAALAGLCRVKGRFLSDQALTIAY